MPRYSNYYKNTAVPVNTSKSGQLSNDDKRQKYFDNFYTKVPSVDPAQFDIVYGFLRSRNYGELVTRNLSISLLEIAKEQGTDPVQLIEQLDQVKDKFQLSTLICIIMNASRNRTSVIGFSQLKTINSTVKRTILA